MNRRRQLELRSRIPQVGPGGIHHPDCPCTRCELGYRTEWERWNQAVRDAKEAKRIQEADHSAKASRRRLNDTAADRAYLEGRRRERELLTEAARVDPRWSRFYELRGEGLSIQEAIAAIDRENHTDADDKGETP